MVKEINILIVDDNTAMLETLQDILKDPLTGLHNYRYLMERIAS